MRTKLGLPGLLSMLALGSASACSHSAQPEPQAGDGEPSPSGEGKGDAVSMPMRPAPGGATGDFSGDCACNDMLERELALDELDEVLGFAAQDVIDQLEGEYVVPVVWVDDCVGATGKSARGCEAARPAFAGSETDVRIAISSSATGARVRECNPDDTTGECLYTDMYLSFEVRLRSADGLLDESIALETSANTAEGGNVGGNLDAAEVNGALRDQVADFAGIEWNFAVSDTQAFFETFVMSDADGVARGLMVTKAPEGVAMPDGHSWGVAVDLEDARQ